MGFEPTEDPKALNSFRDCRLKPLSHLSMAETKGFEPLRHLTMPNAFPGRPIHPLWHVSMDLARSYAPIARLGSCHQEPSDLSGITGKREGRLRPYASIVLLAARLPPPADSPDHNGENDQGLENQVRLKLVSTFGQHLPRLLGQGAFPCITRRHPPKSRTLRHRR